MTNNALNIHKKIRCPEKTTIIEQEGSIIETPVSILLLKQSHSGTPN